MDKIENPELKDTVLDSIGTPNFKNRLLAAVDEEKRKKLFAGWKAELAEFAIEIEERNLVGEKNVAMDYVRSYGEWSKEKNVERPEDADKVNYYFRVGKYQIDLFRERQDHIAIKTDEEIQREAVKAAAEKNINELKEISARHYRLRTDFVKSFGGAKKYGGEICRYAAGVLLAASGLQFNADFELLAELLDLDIDCDTNYDLEDFRSVVAEKSVENPEYVLLACACAVEGKKKYVETKWNVEKCVLEAMHNPSEALGRQYDFLVSVGYEMSDEEKAMQNGTHWLFRDVEIETPCSLCKKSRPWCDGCCRVCEDRCNGWQVCREESEDKK